MRRFLSVLVGASLLAGCSDVTNSLVPEGSGEPDQTSHGVSADIFDGTSDAPGANPHFFFLSPLVPNPDYTGTADDSLKPMVTICPEVFWNAGTESCSNPLATFSMDAVDSGDRINLNPGSGYSVVWKTNSYPAPAGEVFRISVSVFDRVLGWVDVKSYDQQSYNSFQHTDPQGYVAISDNGSANLAFRIEDGALESEFCDTENLEDCDVRVFTYEEEGCLRVFNQPGVSAEILGSQACVPGSAAEIGGQPVDGEFLVIMTLEKEGVFQGGSPNPTWQIPFFPDIRTIPEGIDFDRTGEGVTVTICQAPDVIEEGLHQFLRPFLIFSDGSTALPEDYYFEIGGDCEAFLDHHPEVAAADQGRSRGVFSRLAAGISKATSFFLPQPLNARRRLHGGLNTVVWEIAPPDGGRDNVAGPEGVPGLALLGPGPTILELGALLDVSLSNSWAVVPQGQVIGSTVTIQVHAIDYSGAYFPLELPVIVTAVLRETGETVFTDTLPFNPDPSIPDSSYALTYTPTVVGTYDISIRINGEELGEGFTNEVTPLSGDLVVVVDIAGGAPEDGLPVYLYAGNNSTPAFTATTGSDGSVTFVDIDFGDYTVHLPKRDFDTQFTTMTRAVTHDQAPNTVTFTGTTLAIPGTARVWRIRAGGNGNAFQYVPGGRSWTSAQNQVRGNVLHGAQGHLATATNPGENAFVAAFFASDPALCPNDTSTKKCKVRGWLGMTDEAVEGQFVWVTGEAATWFNWPNGNTAANQPEDRKGNLDHVEIGPDGLWGIINGASSNNDGYFVEWEVRWPGTPPF